MRTMICILVAALLAGCTTRTEFGECVGIADDRDPALVYKLSVWNTVLAVVLFETIFVPIVVLANEISCPVAVKKK